MKHDILIVDDEVDIRLLISGILQDEGMTTREASDADSALVAIQARMPSLVILDIWMQGSRLDGLQLLQEIKKIHPGLPAIMISGHGNIETAVHSIKLGAYEFIEKPFKSDRLLLVVERAIEAARLRRENEELRLRTGGRVQLIGKSGSINTLRNSIEKVAPTGSRVLISGPPGSGKEVVARLLHSNSRRAEGAFVAINCAAMHPDRLEEELFGTEHGINGGPRKLGNFEHAHGGTLLLDEVGDMPLETQGKIVRVLQEQTFTRVGGTTKVEVDVRVIASTNREMTSEIEAGRFREDLYYRLSVVPLKVPALSERREDIPELARHFMSQSAETSGLTPREIGEDAMAALQAYHWPGNTRQLRNVIDWLLIMCGENGDTIRAEMLPPEIGSNTPAVLKWDKGAELMSLPLREAREVFERQYLLAQVTRFGGNISRTASFVGMERSALHRKLKSLGVHERSLGDKATAE